MPEEFDEIEKLKGDKKLPRSVMFKRTLKYVRPEWPSLLLASILVLVSVGVEILYPLFMQQLTNTLQTPTDKTTKIIIMITVGYFTLGVILQIATYFEAMILQKAGTRVVYKLRMEVFEHILNMSQNQFNEMPVGSLVTRVVSYTSSLSELFTSIIVQLTKNILMIVGVYAMMFVISWR